MSNKLANSIVEAACTMAREEGIEFSIIYLHVLGKNYNGSNQMNCLVGIKESETRGFHSLEEAHNFLARKGYKARKGISLMDLLIKCNAIIRCVNDIHDDTNVMMHVMERNAMEILEMKKTISVSGDW